MIDNKSNFLQQYQPGIKIRETKSEKKIDDILSGIFQKLVWTGMIYLCVKPGLRCN